MSPKDALIEQAEMWFVRMRADRVSRQDADAFESWLADSADHAEAYLEVETVWARVDVDEETMAKLLGDHDGDPAGDRAGDRKSAQVPRRRTSRPRQVALAATLLAIAAGILAFVLSGGPEPVRYATEAAERRTVVLDDGATVDLNANTVLMVSGAGPEAALALERGEAFFTVDADRTSVFAVSAGGRAVRVTGTKFNIRTGDAETQVSVVEGSVIINSRESPPVAVTAGQQIAYRGAGDADPIKAFDPARLTSWREGRLIFDAAPLRKIVERLNQYYGQQYRIGDPAIAGMTLSGSFQLDAPEELIAAIEDLLPVHARRDATGYVTFEAR